MPTKKPKKQPGELPSCIGYHIPTLNAMTRKKPIESFGQLLTRIAYRIHDRHESAVLYRRGDGKRWMVEGGEPRCYVFNRKKDAVAKFESFRDAQEGTKQPTLTTVAGKDKGESVRRGENGLP